ncbi:MAG: hypothetical protein C0190_00595 [Thermodesulfobacterium geofontis]|uniref:DUF3108 domain-containing protein n=1 Tax=Thermodesulfobacterium geofontis TaxID=1295609 RepID=A0A2N7PQA2_9BACT|nr:MAG: hypothetical protein C0190_00595 [Thermodesulfobacterium geofontis]
MKNFREILKSFLLSVILNFFLLINCRGTEIKLFYDIYYGPFKIGESEICITPEKYTATVYSVGLANSIFPYYAKWETWVDEKGYPKKTFIYSKERGKERKRVIYFKKEENNVIYQKLLPTYKKPENISLEFPIYDELSSFIASFYIDYTFYPKTKLPLFIKKSREYVRIEFKGRKTCEFEKEEKECLFIEVFLPKKSELLERSSEVEMLLLKEKKVPLELRGKLPIFGSLVGKLKKIEKF